jgi:hypothetical protein
MIPKELEGCESIILGEFAKLRKEIVDFDMCLSLSLSLSLCPHGTTQLPLEGFSGSFDT